MDSVTQVVLGCAVADAVLGARVGRRALAWGAVCGTLPDLDFVLPIEGAIEHYSYHRSWSHSILALTAATPVVSWVIQRIHPATREHRKGWMWLVWLVFMTHILLDCFTVYGTQIFWPLPWSPEVWSTIFIIDPLYTLPLLASTIAAWAWRRRYPERARRWTRAGLVLSSAYLLWTCAAKAWVEVRVRNHLEQVGIDADAILTTPAPFQTLLWRVVVIDGDTYRESYYSLLADGPELRESVHDRDLARLGELRDSWPVQRIAWFTKGFYTIDVENGELVMSDLRMGSEGAYVFRFAIAAMDGDRPTPIDAHRVVSPIPDGSVAFLWQRLWSPDVEPPAPR